MTTKRVAHRTSRSGRDLRLPRFGSIANGIATAAVIVIVIAPILVVASSLLSPERDVWAFLARTTLTRQLLTTGALAVGVGACAALLGSSLAWLIATCDFPGRTAFRRLLVIPMALPSYVVAFVYVGLLQFAGPVQTAWRSWFGADAWFPPVRTPLGAGLVLAFTLYPYVYLPALVAFTERASGPAAAARTLGVREAAVWWRVGVPMARPAIAAGASLVVMETVTDVGVARAFSAQTLSDGILRVWFGMDRRGAAAELAMLLLGLVLVMVTIERLGRGRRRFGSSGPAMASGSTVTLRGTRRMLASVYCSAVLLLAAIVPLATLVVWAVRANQRGFEGALDRTYWGLVRTTLMLAFWTAICCVLLGSYIALRSQQRERRQIGNLIVGRVASFGYAMPGLVVAAGVLVVLAWVDRRFDQLAAWDDRFYMPLLLAGSVVGVIYAMTVRFLGVARENVEAGIARIDPRMLGAAETLGASRVRRLLRVELPMLRGAIAAGALLVVVDCLKELPATLLLRPAGRDTLAVFVWNMTNESRWEEAATPALTIVLIAIPLVLVLLGTISARTDLRPSST